MTRRVIQLKAMYSGQVEVAFSVGDETVKCKNEILLDPESLGQNVGGMYFNRLSFPFKRPT